MKFGTSGLRGLAVDLQGDAAVAYTSAFAEHMIAMGFARPGADVFVGRDHRDSSPRISDDCIAALLYSGLNPIDCGHVPTPALALYAMSRGSASLMITGSHIPADRNGIKFYRPDGEIDKSDELKISCIVAKSGVLAETGLKASIPQDREAAVLNEFKARNLTVLPSSALFGLRVGVYQHSSVARDNLVDLLSAYGADVVPLGRSSSFIPVDTEAVSFETQNKLRSWVAEYRLDAIVSTDGDGDRPLVADETGMPLRGDVLGLMVAEFLGASHLVTPVTSNSGIERGKYRVLRTRVGSPFVIEEMNKLSAAGETGIVGFEANGGVLLQSSFVSSGGQIEALPTRDSYLPILVALFNTKQDGKPLSDIVQRLSLPVTESGRVEDFPVEISSAFLEHLSSSANNLSKFVAPLGSLQTLDQTDGLRINLSTGAVVHFRASGNAPEMRCYVEAADQELSSMLLGKALALVVEWAKGCGRPLD